MSEDEFEEKAVQIYRGNHVDLTLKMEVWKIDGQPCEIPNTPISIHLVLQTAIKELGKKTKTELMDHCQRLYQDRASLL